jgi:hypothetical protein
MSCLEILCASMGRCAKKHVDSSSGADQYFILMHPDKLAVTCEFPVSGAIIHRIPSKAATVENVKPKHQSRKRFNGRQLVGRGLLTAEVLRRACREHCGIPPFRKSPQRTDSVPGVALPASFLRARLPLPVCAENGTITVAMADPLDADAREAVFQATGRKVEVLAGTEEAES